MPETPRVTITGGARDVLGADDEPPAPRRGLLLPLALAALVGFGVAQAVPPLAADPPVSSGASLTLVTGRRVFLDAVGEPPVPSLEVVLVNTGAGEVRLLGGIVEGTALTWAADRRLEAGRQATVVLREEGACDRESDALSGPGAPRELIVRVQDGPEQRLALEPAVTRAYDDHVRNVCSLPRLPQALELLSGRASTDDDGVLVSFGLLSRTVRPLRVLDVTAAAGLDVTLTDDTGRPVVLPLELPGLPREQIYVFPDTDDPGTTPYRVRITSTPDQCPALQEPVDGALPRVSVVYEGDEQEGLTATRQLFVDLAEYARRLCG